MSRLTRRTAAVLAWLVGVTFDTKSPDGYTIL